MMKIKMKKNCNMCLALQGRETNKRCFFGIPIEFVSEYHHFPGCSKKFLVEYFKPSKICAKPRTKKQFKELVGVDNLKGV